jgi:hypothetical protein
VAGIEDGGEADADREGGDEDGLRKGGREGRKEGER